MPRQSAAAPEWSARILRLLEELKITQAGLAERLGVSPATVSRWIQGKHEPTAEGYVLLGNLARPSECAYFWERAGVEISRLAGSGDKPAGSSNASGPASSPVSGSDVQLLGEHRGPRSPGKPVPAVAIPLLAVTAYGDAEPPRENVRLSEAKVEETLLAPPEWCPHPDQMIAMHIAGDSMMPLIGPDSILFVDRSETDRDKLNHKIVVVSHRDLGFKVARFQRVGGADLLLAANHKYPPMDVSNAAKWKLFGEVLWWVTRSTAHAA